MEENEFPQPGENEGISQELDSIQEGETDLFVDNDPMFEPEPPRKSGWLAFVLTILLFILLIVGGYYGWQEIADWREVKSVDYSVKAAQFVENNDKDALWELEKAYWLGLEIDEYRQERAVYLAKLGHADAKSDLADVIEKGWGNDLINYYYGKILFDDGKYEESADYLKKVSPEVDYAIKKDIFVRLAVMAGNDGQWEGVQSYLDQSEKISGTDELENRVVFALDLINDDLDSALLLATIDEVSETSLEELSELKGDAYLLRVTDVLIDIGLNGWADYLLDQASFETLDQFEVLLLKAKNSLVTGECQMAWNYLVQAQVIDASDKKIHQMLVDVYKCLDYEDFASYEEFVLTSI